MGAAFVANGEKGVCAARAYATLALRVRLVTTLARSRASKFGI